MRILGLIFAVTTYLLWGAYANTDFTEKFEKQSIYGKWIDIDQGKIIEIDSKSQFSFERLDNSLIILKEANKKSYLKRIGALKTRITGRIMQIQGTEAIPVKGASILLVNSNDPSIQTTIKTNAQGLFKDESLPSGTYTLTTKQGMDTLSVEVELVQKNEALGSFVLRSNKEANFKSTLLSSGEYIITNKKEYKSIIRIKNYGSRSGKVCYRASMDDKDLVSLNFDNGCQEVKAGGTIRIPIRFSFNPIEINSVQKELTVTLIDANGHAISEKHPFDVYKNYFTMRVTHATKSLKGYVLLPGEKVEVIDIKKGYISLPKLSDEDYRLILANPNPKLKTSYEVDIGAEQNLLKGIVVKKEDRANRDQKTVNPFKLKQSIGRYPDVGDIAIYSFTIADTIVLNEDDRPVKIRFTNVNDLGEKVKYKVAITNEHLADVAYANDYLTVSPKTNRSGIATITLKSASVGYGQKSKKYFTLIVQPVNDLPVITSTPETKVIEKKRFTYYLKAKDKETKYLTKSVVEKPSWLQFNASQGLLTGIPKANDAGKRYKITLSVRDDRDTVFQTFDLEVVALAKAPKVEEASYIVKEDTTLKKTLIATTTQGLKVSFAIVQSTQNGVIRSSENGDFTYVPNPNFFGSDSFTFKATSNGKSTLSKVSLIVKAVNDSPTASDITVNEIGAGPVNVEWSKLADTEDIDEDKLILQILSKPERGSVKVDDENFVYTPNANTQGSERLLARVSDPSGAYADITIYLNGIDKKLTPRVLQTGQTIIYHSYDDAIYKKSIPRSYTQEINSTIIEDEVSLKSWYVEPKSVKRSFKEAQRFCAELKHEGVTAWGLPTLKELVFISDKGRTSPAIDPLFKGVKSSYYWSSTLYKKRPGHMWVVNFDYGEDYYRHVQTENYTMCIHEGLVRKPKVLKDANSSGAVAFDRNSSDVNGTVDDPKQTLRAEEDILVDTQMIDDNETLPQTLAGNAVEDENNSSSEAPITLFETEPDSGYSEGPNYYERNDSLQVVYDTQGELMWYDGEPIPTRTWVAAITVCENLVFAGFDDWRVPNFNELYRITDHSGLVPAISESFIRVDVGDYWSSTTSHNDQDRAWGISFSKGSDYTFDKTERIFVRCVRDQQ